VPRRLLVLLVVLLAGCGADDWSQPHAKPTAIGKLGPGFIDAPPAPEATITPRSGSWDAVRPSKGYRVVLLTAGPDKATRTLVDAVDDWADDVDASLKTVTAKDATEFIPSIREAMALKPDLIIAAGNELVDPLALVSANHLDQHFLIVGAEVAEPTYNVTAADWPGASFRGEGLKMSESYDPATFTRDRADRAVRAGVAAVLNGITGIVIRLD
jgi:ABC-type Fe3+-hydroxamate transport system substrate-binding protein